MNYVGIDWAYGRAAFCAMGEGGANTAWVVALLRCKFLPALRARRTARWLSLAEGDQQSSCYWRWGGKRLSRT